MNEESLININDIEYLSFLKIIKGKLDNYPVKEITRESLKPAAVFMLFMEKNGIPHVLLTKRSDKVKDHKGQISFPGGAYDDEDDDLLATAYRETLEEVGIPESEIAYIGRFDDYISISGYKVATFIGAVEHPVNYNLSEYEIDEHIEVPFSIFYNLEYDRTEKFWYEGVDHTVYYYLHYGHEIWGMTARILTDFVENVLRN